ncbi:PD-(D/E)XK nuclease family protein [Fontimonas sp. SYSU GA230001]|uniref:PD-(D/E)XK nuclease family protein n=1 Tax=Fontimonas sp. SYSU GA230001 TaxID=3142450 RepID=UPI0032B51924
MEITDLSELEREALFELLSAAGPAAPDAPVVLCASARLAQHLQDAYARWQLARGATAWPTPLMRTAESWLFELGEQQRLRLQTHRAPVADVLTETESALIWRLIVAESCSELPLLREADAATLAAEAWRLCEDHDLRRPLPAVNADVERFNLWAQAYARRCERLQRVDRGVQRRALIEALAARRLPAPARLVLAGHDRCAPWLQALIAALRAAGSQLYRLRAPRQTANISARIAADAEQELRLAADWVRERARAEPRSRIGVIVPDLQARRADVLRVFDQALCASVDALPPTAGERPYNLSLGEPLAGVGVVQCALTLLRLCVGPIDLAQAGALLCNPYWGAGPDEILARADLDRVLRERGHLQVDLPLLAGLARSLPQPAGRARFEQLLRLRTLGAAEPGDWAERFGHWLDAAGWPGPRTPDSAEFQALEAWRGLLRELAGLGRVSGRIGASGALVQLEQLARQRVFQPQTPPVNIQVLGALEAEGLDFDALWVLGLDDERWPSRRPANPFIPHELQRRFELPHASSAQDLAWAERMTARWREAAAEVVFSWAAREEDRELSPSPLIAAEARSARLHPVDPIAPAWRAVQATGHDEQRADDHAPPPDDEVPVPGGARLLGDQARCPFRAFATHRLGAQPLEQPGYGPNHFDRGLLVHRVLERLWRALHTQAALLALDDAGLRLRIDEAVTAELDALATANPQRFTPALRRLEVERLRALVGEWMERERERPAFVVELLEGSPPSALRGQQERVSFGGMQLQLRPDRIDRLADGSRLVIDYKTAARRPAPWRDGRPDEPQLLLYALTRPDVAGLAYARLRAGSVGFDGLGAQADLAPGVRDYADVKETRDATSWDGLMGRWRGQLETLTGEVRRGLASVTPKHPRQSCRDCHLHAVCRIREHVAAAEFDDEAGVDA